MNLRLTAPRFDWHSESVDVCAVALNDLPQSLCGDFLLVGPSDAHGRIVDNFKLRIRAGILSALKHCVEDHSQHKSQVAVLYQTQNVIYAISVGGAYIQKVIDGKKSLIVKSTPSSSQAGSGYIVPGETFVLVVEGKEVEVGVVKVDKRSLKKILVTLIDKTLAHLPQGKVGQEDIFGEYKAQKNKRLAVVVGVALSVVLIVSIALGIKRKQTLLIAESVQVLVTSAKADLQEARSLKDLSKARARELLLRAQKSIAEAKTKSTDPEIVFVDTSIKDSLGQIAGLYKGESELFLDLSLISSNFYLQFLSANESSLLLFDSVTKKLVTIDLLSKKTQVEEEVLLENIVSTALYSGRKFILAQGGIFEVKNSPVSISSSANTNALLYAFAGNLYLLDKQDNSIYRYQGQNNSFSEKNAWFAAGMNVDLADAIDWSIDGSIWVLHENGIVSKFSLGKVDYFEVASEVVGKFRAIYTNDSIPHIYLLDSENKKIWVVDKKGQFVAEYDDDRAGEATFMKADNESKKLILGTKDKLYSIELRDF